MIITALLQLYRDAIPTLMALTWLYHDYRDYHSSVMIIAAL